MAVRCGHSWNTKNECAVSGEFSGWLFQPLLLVFMREHFIGSPAFKICCDVGRRFHLDFIIEDLTRPSWLSV